MNSTYVSEIYTSLQGEGPYTGEKQIFVRLAGCPLRCDYCDTPGSLIGKGHPRLTVAKVLRDVLRERRLHGAQTVSITGGEPLAHVGFLEELLPALKAKKLRVYLETAGVHPKNLSRVIRDCDVIAMDIKLPSATGRNYWREHEQFIEQAEGKAFVKIVVEQSSKKSEIAKAVDLLSARPVSPLLVLQPVTPENPGVEAPTSEQLGDFYSMAAKRLRKVLIMPQQHKVWGLR